MLVITQNELAKNLNKYLNMLPDEKVVVKRENAFIELNYRDELPEEDEYDFDDTLMPKEEFFAMVDERVNDYETGKSKAISYTEELRQELFGDL